MTPNEKRIALTGAGAPRVLGSAAQFTSFGPATTVHRALIAVSMLLTVASCAHDNHRAAVTPLPPRGDGPPFVSGQRLTDEQLDWYVQRAILGMRTRFLKQRDGRAELLLQTDTVVASHRRRHSLTMVAR